MTDQADFELTRRRARATRAKSVLLRSQSATARSHTDVLVDGIVQSLVQAFGLPVNGRSFGDRSDHFALRLPRLPQSVRVVRSSLRAWLSLQGIARDVASDIVLASSEACANAVQHPQRPAQQVFEIAAHRAGDDVVVAVRDFGRWSSGEERDETRGRGFAMMRTLMDAVEVTSSDEGAELVMRRFIRPSPDISER